MGRNERKTGVAYMSSGYIWPEERASKAFAIAPKHRLVTKLLARGGMSYTTPMTENCGSESVFVPHGKLAIEISEEIGHDYSKFWDELNGKPQPKRELVAPLARGVVREAREFWSKLNTTPQSRQE